jgi:hypothetical protein
MKLRMLKTLLSSITSISLCVPCVALAQGGNGNGGSGGGGAHGAATSGMTYHSEPVSSPWAVAMLSGNREGYKDAPKGGAHSLPPDDNTNPLDARR